jgi:hypothetical protein
MSRVYRTVAIVITLVGMGAAASGQESTRLPPYRFRLLGTFDGLSGDPIVGVEVIDLVNGTTATTSKDGIVSLAFLAEGRSIIRLRKLGYQAQTMVVAISPADTSSMTILLSRATVLPTTVVTDSSPRHASRRLRDFESRRRAGFGYFVGEAELRKNDGRSLANTVVSFVPGVLTVPGPQGTATYVASARKMCSGPALAQCSGPSCVVDVYQDGVLMPAPVDLDRLAVADYGGIEFYHGGADSPSQYNATRNGCGTLLLWSRDRV